VASELFLGPVLKSDHCYWSDVISLLFFTSAGSNASCFAPVLLIGVCHAGVRA